MNERQFLEKFRQTPEGQKLLRTIRFAEGTAGPKGYQTMFGGGTFSDFRRHPNRVIRSGGYASAAAGAYQFLPGSWQSQAKALGLSDFSPSNQDLAALRAARNRLMPIGGLSVLQKEGFTPRVANALAPEWASIPTLSGTSYYGQPSKPLSRLQEVYGSAPTTVAAAPTPGTGGILLPPGMGSVPTIPQRKEKAKSLLDAFKENAISTLLSNAISPMMNFNPFSFLQ